MNKIKKLALILMFVSVIRVDVAFPQASVSRSELRGQITDQNGAVVAGATITLTDAARGTTRTVQSDENGLYVFLSLPPGTYSMKVEAAGFAAQTYGEVHLDVGQIGNVPVSLRVGDVKLEVEIAAGGQVVEVERTQQSSVINEVQIDNLPINRRNYLDFALLTPGVTDSDSINDSTDFRVAQTPQSGLSFGGNNGRGNSIMVDGASTDTGSGASREVIGQEGVQEFQVNRNTYSAEYGGAFGGVVNIISKTGENNWHGSAFGYFRNERFDAKNFFDQNPSGKSPFNRQQFGGSLGGPITRDKTFFFTSFEGLRQKQTSFVNLLNDPNVFSLTSTQSALLGFLDGAPDAGLRGLSGALRGALTIGSRTRSLFETGSGQFPFDAFDTVGTFRVDHNFSSRDSGYARFGVSDAHFENQAAGALTAVSRGRTINTFTSGLLLSETHFFSPTTINEMKAQYSYLNNDVIANDLIGPEINIDGFGNFGRDIFLPSFAIERRYEINDSISLVRSSHTWKFGGQYVAVNNSSNSQTFFGGRFNFTAQLPFISLVPAAARPGLIGFLTTSGGALGQDKGGGGLTLCSNPSITGCPNGIPDSLDAPINGVQAFNVNLPTVYQQGFGESGFDSWSHRYSFYGQDTWKVRPNFTFSLGARYYLERNVDPMPLDKNNIQPRVGFAWDPWHDGKTAIRGGYGIYVGQIDNQIVNVVNELSSMGDPSNINIVLATATSNALPLSPANPAGPRAPSSFQVYQTLLAQGVIGNRTITLADLAQFGVAPGPGATLEVRFRVGPNYENPYTQQASFAIQRDLGGGYGVEVSYLFSRAAHITRNHDVNPFKMSGPVSPLSGTPTFVRFPGAGQTTDFINPFRLQDNNYESTGNAFYHAGTIQLTKRFSHNFSINSNYTFSKAIDEVTDFNSDFSAENPLDLRADRALSAFDQRHRFVFSGVFNSPFGGDTTAGRIFGNWVLSPIFITGSGRPFNVLLGIDANGDGVSTRDRPCLRTATDQPCNPGSNLGRNTGRGEAYYNVDMRLGRRFKFAESKYLELTFESFNLFNHTNFIGINNIIGATPLTDGHPTGIRGRAPTQPFGFTAAAPSRQLQFGARFNF
ncbi:MAG TPA: carboxypeptidase regulatory-like domain-containing protein [Blastocatellia bacterium]|nr:carboxypeptidase regulatory-like domain-containing protein [Blastocatellia bacterium]